MSHKCRNAREIQTNVSLGFEETKRKKKSNDSGKNHAFESDFSISNFQGIQVAKDYTSGECEMNQC